MQQYLWPMREVHKESSTSEESWASNSSCDWHGGPCWYTSRRSRLTNTRGCRYFRANPIWRSRASICSASAEAHERAVQTGRPISCVEAGPGKRFWEPSRGFPGPIYFMFFSFTGFLFFLFSSVFVFYLFYFFFPFLLCFFVFIFILCFKKCSKFQILFMISKLVHNSKKGFYKKITIVQRILQKCTMYI